MRQNGNFAHEKILFITDLKQVWYFFTTREIAGDIFKLV